MEEGGEEEAGRGLKRSLLRVRKARMLTLVQTSGLNVVPGLWPPVIAYRHAQRQQRMDMGLSPMHPRPFPSDLQKPCIRMFHHPQPHGPTLLSIRRGRQEGFSCGERGQILGHLAPGRQHLCQMPQPAQHGPRTTVLEQLQRARKRINGQGETRLVRRFQDRTAPLSSMGNVEHTHRVWSVQIDEALQSVRAIEHGSHRFRLGDLSAPHLSLHPFPKPRGIRHARTRCKLRRTGLLAVLLHLSNRQGPHFGPASSHHRHKRAIGTAHETRRGILLWHLLVRSQAALFILHPSADLPGLLAVAPNRGFTHLHAPQAFEQPGCTRKRHPCRQGDQVFLLRGCHAPGEEGALVIAGEKVPSYRGDRFPNCGSR